MAKSDIEIAREATLKPITEIADKLGIPASALLPYGYDKGKITLDYIKSLASLERVTGTLLEARNLRIQ